MTTCLGNCCSPGCCLWCLWWCLFVLSFFPRGVLDEILNLIESVSEEFPSYSCRVKKVFIISEFMKYFVSKILNISLKWTALHVKDICMLYCFGSYSIWSWRKKCEKRHFCWLIADKAYWKSVIFSYNQLDLKQKMNIKHLFD